MAIPDEVISKLQDKAFPGTIISDNDAEFWSIEYLVDKLFLCLAEVKETVNNKGEQMHIKKYYRQATELLKWIPISRPTPVFIINISDLPERILKEFELVRENDARAYVLTQAVGRIFENLDLELYHMSIARNLRVGFER